MFETKLIIAAIVLSFLLIYPLTQLHSVDRNTNQGKKLPKNEFDWYLDLRRYGSVPHAGFGMGIERVVAWICKLSHVRETIPYPRMIQTLRP